MKPNDKDGWQFLFASYDEESVEIFMEKDGEKKIIFEPIEDEI